MTNIPALLRAPLCAHAFFLLTLGATTTVVAKPVAATRQPQADAAPTPTAAEAASAIAKPLPADAPVAKPLTAEATPDGPPPAKPLPGFDPESRKLFIVRYGIQFSHESADFAQTKIASFAFLDALSRRWVYSIEAGGWADKGNGGAKNLSGSLYVTANIGVEVTLDSVWSRILVGPTLISHTDARLSTNFQIHHEFSLGIRSKNGLGIGAFLKHFSNGGIKLPNESRDLFGFVVQFAI